MPDELKRYVKTLDRFAASHTIAAAMKAKAVASLPDAMRTALIVLDINQRELSRRLGIHPVYISYLLNGRHEAGDRILLKLRELLRGAL